MPEKLVATCVDSRYVKFALTEGDDYTVEWFSSAFPVRCGGPLVPAYEVICDDGVPRMYAVTRFITKNNNPDEIP